MRYILLTSLMIVITGSILFSQTVDRHFNPTYAWTTFKEDFSDTTLNREVWKPTTRFKRGLGFLIDSTETIKVEEGNLVLMMKRIPNYLDSLWTPEAWKREYSDYVGGEVNTIRKFRYGVFECKAKYAHKKGSWPAFWLFGDSAVLSPTGSLGNEIDIAELARNGAYPKMMHVIHYYFPSKDTLITAHENPDRKIYSIPRQQKYYTFKCIWTPEKIQYFIDNELKHEVINKDYEWFPKLPLNVILSQQVIQVENKRRQAKLIAPQASLFDWVTVREFFLAPEITCPAAIAQQDTATLEVDNRASDITWKLTPDSLFTISEGSGKTAIISRTQNSSGPGKITYIFIMPSGEVFTAEKQFD